MFSQERHEALACVLTSVSSRAGRCPKILRAKQRWVSGVSDDMTRRAGARHSPKRGHTRHLGWTALQVGLAWASLRRARRVAPARGRPEGAALPASAIAQASHKPSFFDKAWMRGARLSAALLVALAFVGSFVGGALLWLSSQPPQTATGDPGVQVGVSRAGATFNVTLTPSNDQLEMTFELLGAHMSPLPTLRFELWDSGFLSLVPKPALPQVQFVGDKPPPPLVQARLRQVSPGTGAPIGTRQNGYELQLASDATATIDLSYFKDATLGSITGTSTASGDGYASTTSGGSTLVSLPVPYFGGIDGWDGAGELGGKGELQIILPPGEVQYADPAQTDIEGAYSCSLRNCPGHVSLRIASDKEVAAAQDRNVVAGILFAIGGSLLVSLGTPVVRHLWTLSH